MKLENAGLKSYSEGRPLLNRGYIFYLNGAKIRLADVVILVGNRVIQEDDWKAWKHWKHELIDTGETILINADIKSQQDAEHRLLGGETFYRNGIMITYDDKFIKEGQSPFRFGDHPLSTAWKRFAEWEKQVPVLESKNSIEGEKKGPLSVHFNLYNGSVYGFDLASGPDTACVAKWNILEPKYMRALSDTARTDLVPDLVPVKLHSELEATELLYSGATLYYLGTAITYNDGFKPFKGLYIKLGGVPCSPQILQYYTEFKVKRTEPITTYSTLRNRLRYASNTMINPDSTCGIAIIESFHPQRTYPYHSFGSSQQWKYSTPITEKDLKEYE